MHTAGYHFQMQTNLLALWSDWSSFHSLPGEEGPKKEAPVVSPTVRELAPEVVGEKKLTPPKTSKAITKESNAEWLTGGKKLSQVGTDKTNSIQSYTLKTMFPPKPKSIASIVGNYKTPTKQLTSLWVRSFSN